MPEAVLKAKAPSFYRSSPSAPKTAASGSNLKKHWPIIGALVLVGVAIVFFLRSRSLSSSANVGPALTLYPDTSADSSGLANAIQGARAIGNIQRSAGSGGDTQINPLPGEFPSNYPQPDNHNTSPGATPIGGGTTASSGGVNLGAIGENSLAGSGIAEANSYWNAVDKALAAMPGSAPAVNSGVLAWQQASQDPFNASPEVTQTADQYRALVLGQVNAQGQVTGHQDINVQQGLTAQAIRNQIAYLQNIQKTGAYNPSSAMISSPQAVSSLIESEQKALASGAYH